MGILGSGHRLYGDDHLKVYARQNDSYVREHTVAEYIDELVDNINREPTDFGSIVGTGNEARKSRQQFILPGLRVLPHSDHQSLHMKIFQALHLPPARWQTTLRCALSHSQELPSHTG